MAAVCNSLSYEQFVVVAEEEWEIYNYRLEGVDGPTGFSTNFGKFHCTLECNFNKESEEGQGRQLVVRVDFEQSDRDQQAHIEVFLGRQKMAKKGAFIPFEGMPQRHLLNLNRHNPDAVAHFTHSYTYPADYGGDNGIRLTMRLLKERSALPDFTKETVQLRPFKWDCKLRVGEQFFHVNKEVLAFLSPYFKQMFNGNLNEAKKEEIELKGEIVTSNAAAFHDFLHIMQLSFDADDVFPNSKNVVALLELAEFFQVASVRDKCARHLKHCHEMPVLERIVLAQRNGFKHLLTQCFRDCSAEDMAQLAKAYVEKIDSEL